MKILGECLLVVALSMLTFACAQSQIFHGSRDGSIFGQVVQNPLQFSENQQFAQPSRKQGITHLHPVFSPSANIAVTAGFSQSPLQDSRKSTSDFIADSVLQFGHNVGLHVNGLNGTNSEIFSPLSVVSALSLLMLGSRGKSYLELETLIGLDRNEELAQHPAKYHEEFSAMLDDLQHYVQNNANGQASKKRKPVNWRDSTMKRPANPGATVTPNGPVEHTISVANGMFVQNNYSLNPDYIQIVKSVYESELTQVDYQRHSLEARDLINQWVDRSTHGKIPQIITGDIAKATNIIMASVVYFRGFWETGFFPRSTGENDFFPDGVQNPPIRVQMMATGGVFPYYDAKEYDCRIIGLPYKGNETTMYVIQPNDSSREKLRALQATLNAHKINEMIDNMVLKTTVMVFPKMHFSRTLNMKSMLQKLGLHDIFEPSLSDLTLIAAQPSTVPNAPIAPVFNHAAFQPSEERIQNIFNTNKAREMPTKSLYFDRYHEPALIFRNRFGEETDQAATTTAPGIDEPKKEEHKIITRQAPISRADQNRLSLLRIEDDRLKLHAPRSDLFVDDILHKVDFAVDEYGTEAAAATLTYLHRSGTDVVFRGDTPFLIVIRHDPTKLPLFYGIINKPEL